MILKGGRNFVQLQNHWMSQICGQLRRTLKILTKLGRGNLIMSYINVFVRSELEILRWDL